MRESSRPTLPVPRRERAARRDIAWRHDPLQTLALVHGRHAVDLCARRFRSDVVDVAFLEHQSGGALI
ncbi:hypothetical protein HDG33_001457 [Paraburkholderia sp. Cpub6]|nr:hypothetical protein [Paraburkholderia sp. Cpub6]